MKKQKGFTLIELLVVIAILGILSTLAVVSLQNAREKGRDAKRISDIRQIQTALELYMNDSTGYPETTGDITLGEDAVALTNNGFVASTGDTDTVFYMRQVPKAQEPADGGCGDANDYIYTSQDDGASYTISFCLGGQTGSLTAGVNTATPGGIISSAE